MRDVERTLSLANAKVILLERTALSPFVRNCELARV
jgi:hypothetical protein